MSKAREIISIIEGADEDKSAKTAISRSTESAPVRWLKENGHLSKGGNTLDYGCGKGSDANKNGWDKYDPATFPEMPEKTYDKILCQYVLNTLPKEKEASVMSGIRKKLKSGGEAFIVVRRDIEKQGETSKGTYQRNVTLGAESLHKENGFEIYKIKKS